MLVLVGLLAYRVSTSDTRLVAEAHSIWRRTGFRNMTREERRTAWRLADRATDILGSGRRVQDLHGSERDVVEEAVRCGLMDGAASISAGTGGPTHRYPPTGRARRDTSRLPQP